MVSSGKLEFEVKMAVLKTSFFYLLLTISVRMVVFKIEKKMLAMVWRK